MTTATPHGVTPPAPGLEHEEPELISEADIPADDAGWRWATAEMDQLGRQ